MPHDKENRCHRYSKFQRDSVQRHAGSKAGIDKVADQLK
jgi:hypothetical protein